MKGISRIDSRRCHGWLVRSYRNSRTYSKLFSDSKYGGRFPARKMAYEFRRHQEETLPPTQLTHTSAPPFKVDGELSKANKSGVNGVSLLYGSEKRKKIIIGYSVNYIRHGKQHNKSFPSLRYGGKQAALRSAVAFRKKMERYMLRVWKKSTRLSVPA
jgi:hypothetical protein